MLTRYARGLLISTKSSSNIPLIPFLSTTATSFSNQTNKQQVLINNNSNPRFFSAAAAAGGYTSRKKMKKPKVIAKPQESKMAPQDNLSEYGEYGNPPPMSRMGYYTSAFRGNRVTAQGTKWTDLKRQSLLGAAKRNRKTAKDYATLDRRQKEMKTRRPNSLLSTSYLPHKEVSLGRQAGYTNQHNRVADPGRAQKKIKTFDDVRRGLLYCRFGKSNFIFSLTKTNGNKIAQISGNAMKLDKFSRKAPFAAEEAARIVSSNLGKNGIEMVDVILKGTGFQNFRIGAIIKGLQNNNIITRRVKKDLSVPHGGCRPKKHRRI